MAVALAEGLTYVPELVDFRLKFLWQSTPAPALPLDDVSWSLPNATKLDIDSTQNDHPRFGTEHEAVLRSLPTIVAPKLRELRIRGLPTAAMVAPIGALCWQTPELQLLNFNYTSSLEQDAVMDTDGAFALFAKLQTGPFAKLTSLNWLQRFDVNAVVLRFTVA